MDNDCIMAAPCTPMLDNGYVYVYLFLCCQIWAALVHMAAYFIFHSISKAAHRGSIISHYFYLNGNAVTMLYIDNILYIVE